LKIKHQSKQLKMLNNNQDAHNFDLFEVEELESRFEMGKWIEFVPCECPPNDGETPSSGQ
jgi:hypothetical protein